MDQSNTKHRTFLWGHRGACGHEVENTVESFELALKMGADRLESDVHLTKDNQMIFLHDYWVIWQGKKTPVRKLTWDQIQQISLPKGRKIPRVQEIFTYFKDRKTQTGQPIRYSLDIEYMKDGYAVIKMAEQFGIAQLVELTPNDAWPGFWRKIQKFRKMSPNIQIVDSAHFEAESIRKIAGFMGYQNYAKLQKCGVKAMNIKAALMSDDRIAEIRHYNFMVYVWDCNTDEVIKKFLEKNVDAIYSDYPDKAVQLRNEIQTIS